MSEEEPIIPKDDLYDQKLVVTKKEEIKIGTTPPSSRSVIYSTLILAILLLLSAGLELHILHEAIIRESGKIIAETTETREGIYRVLAKDASPVGNNAAVGSKQAAAGQRALDLGKQALAAGETDKALLYFINGVNHDPGRMDLVQSLANAALQSRDLALCERAVGILELATLQISPDDMSTVLNFTDKLRAKGTPPPPRQISPEDAANRLQELHASYDPNLIWSDASKVASGISEIEFIQQVIDVSRADNTDDRYFMAIQKSSEFSTSLQRLQGSLFLYQHVSTCLEQMNSIVQAADPDVVLFTSVSASAQAVLAQIWGGINSLPEAMQKKLYSFPEQMKTIEEDLKLKISTGPYLKTVSILSQARSSQKGSITDRIFHVTDAMEKVAIEAEAIASNKLRIQYFEEIKKTKEHLVHLELDRRAAYQQWALQCANAFMTEWNDYKVGTNKRAKSLFHKYSISEIDETLLVPEVSRVVGRVMTCVTGELDSKGGAEIEFQMGASKKKRLEDF